MSEELPEGWAAVPLGEVVENLDGRRVPVKASDRAARRGAYPYYGASGAIDTIDDFLFDGTYLLIGEDGANLLSRSTPLAFEVTGKFWVNNHAHVLGERDGLELPYLKHFINSFDLQHVVTGTAQPKLTQAALNNIEVPLAPLAEQRRIVAKVEELLAQVNAAEDHLAKVPAILKRFRQSILAAACSGKLTEDLRVADEPDEDSAAPASWSLTRAEDLLLDAKYGTSAKCGYEPKAGIPVVRIPNIAKGELDLSDLKFAPKGAEDWAKLGLAAGDVLVCRTNGSLDLIGKAAVVATLNTTMSFASYLIRLRCDQQRLLPAYFHLFLTSPLGRDQIEVCARTSAGQFNINLEILRNLEVPLPPLSEQAAIVERARLVLAEATRIERSMATAERASGQIPQAILAKAFRGELVPTEAELARAEGRDYETAEQLLARVRAVPATVTSGARTKPAKVRSKPRDPGEPPDGAAPEVNDEPKAKPSKGTGTQRPPGPSPAALDTLATLDEDALHAAVFAALWPRGPLERDVAVRLVAEHLRDAGNLAYQRLRADGPLYATVLEAVESAVKEGVLDRCRPLRRGYVRAIKADAKAWSPDDWRHALVASLGGEPTDREDAIRLAAECARETMGLDFERLRSDGHIAQGLRSALNSAIRRGEVVRHDAKRISRAELNGGSSAVDLRD